MALDDDIRILSAVDLFSELTAEQLRLLAFGAESMRFSEGREIYRPGAPADSAFVVARGTVDLYQDGEEGRVVLASYGAGAILGELALITATQRLTGAVAASDVEVVRISRTLFRRILEEYPDLAARLHAHISRDLEALLRRIEKLAPRFSD